MQQQALANNTVATYSTGASAYVRFCIYFGFQALPVTEHTLASFVAFQSDSCTYSTLKVYLSGIRDWALRAGHSFTPVREQHQVHSALQGVRRVKGDAQRSKLAITPEILLGFLPHLTFSCHNDRMVWAAMLLAFFGLFRKDNITVGKASAFNPRANLTRGDFSYEHRIIWVRVKHSKTIQFNQREHWVPVTAIREHPLCPVNALIFAFKHYPGRSPDAPAFTWEARPQQFEPLTHLHFVNSLKHLLGKSGLRFGDYSGHSFRRGGATFAHQCGMSAEMIKAQGDWKSDAYTKYLAFPAHSRLSLPKSMAKAISLQQ